MTQPQFSNVPDRFIFDIGKFTFSLWKKKNLWRNCFHVSRWGGTDVQVGPLNIYQRTAF